MTALQTHTREERPHVLRNLRHPQRGPRRPPRRRQNNLVRSPAACRRRPDHGRHGRTRHHGVGFRPDGKGARPFDGHRHRLDRPHRRRRAQHPPQPDRHPRLPGIPRPGAVGTGGGGNGADRGRCRHRRSPRHRAPDGAGRRTRPVPGDRGQQDRSRTGQLRAGDGAAARGLRQRCAAAEPAGRRRRPRGRLLRRVQRGFGPGPGGRLAPAHPRPGGGGGRRSDGAFPRRRRGRAVATGAARRLRKIPARRPSGAGVLRLGAHGRGREGAAARGASPVPRPHRRQSAAAAAARRPGRAAAADRCRRRRPRHRRGVQDRQRPVRGQAGRVPRLPGHGAARHPAVRRRGPQVVQGRAPVPAARQGACGSGRSHPRRHRRGGQDR